MSFYQFKWLRRFFRKNMNPIPVDKASTMKQRLSIVYMILAWNAFGLVCYMVFTGRSDWARYHGLKTDEEAEIPPARQWAQTLNIPKAKVYRFSGLSKQYEYEIDQENNDNVTEEINT